MAEIKQSIADIAIQEIIAIRNNLISLTRLSHINLALETTMPRASFIKRIEEVQKDKRTIDELNKAVDIEKTLIISEISAEIERLSQRLAQINAKFNWLFPDVVKLIASQDNLTPIIQKRIAEEEQRVAKIIAKAKQEAKLRAEREAKVKTKLKARLKSLSNEHKAFYDLLNKNFTKTDRIRFLENVRMFFPL